MSILFNNFNFNNTCDFNFLCNNFTLANGQSKTVTLAFTTNQATCPTITTSQPLAAPAALRDAAVSDGQLVGRYDLRLIEGVELVAAFEEEFDIEMDEEE